MARRHTHSADTEQRHTVRRQLGLPHTSFRGLSAGFYNVNSGKHSPCTYCHNTGTSTRAGRGYIWPGMRGGETLSGTSSLCPCRPATLARLTARRLSSLSRTRCVPFLSRLQVRHSYTYTALKTWVRNNTIREKGREMLSMVKYTI